MADVDIEYDVNNLRVNFSEEEASSTAIDLEPVPTGKYHCAITEIETRFSNSEKNKGKPYLAITLNCISGPYENRKFWANVMLFEGALYSLAQLLKATGHADALKTGAIPGPDEFIGKEVVVYVAKVKDTYKMKKEGTDEVLYKNEVKGFKPFDGGSSSGGGDSLLP